MIASQAQRVQANPLAAAAALRYWAQMVNRSDQTLEAFAELEFELATTPAERDIAIEFFRRVYLNNGVTTALDLAIALVEYNARDPEVADEIEHLLTMAGNRGEGGAIRLLSRLQANVRWFDDGTAPNPVERATRDLANGDPGALMRLVTLTANSDLPSYDPEAAVAHIMAGVSAADTKNVAAIAGIYRGTTDEIRTALDGKIDLNTILRSVAQTGDVDAAFELGMRLRAQAEGQDDLAQSLDWLEAAAQRGHREAMYQVGYALGFGLGRPADPSGAINWLDQATGMGHADARALAKTLRIAGGL